MQRPTFRQLRFKVEASNRPECSWASRSRERVNYAESTSYGCHGSRGRVLSVANMSQVQAGMITLKLGGLEYSGSGGNTLPENALQLIFEDAGTNKVKLTIDGTHLPLDTDKVTVCLHSTSIRPSLA